MSAKIEKSQNNLISSDASVHWLVNTLKNDIGWVEWIPKTPEELAAFKESLPESMRATAYPLKVVEHPIPEGDIIKLNSSKDYLIACNCQEIRETLIGLAQRYDFYRQGYYQNKSDQSWRFADDVPDGPGSSIRNRTVIVTSDILTYVGGVHIGYHNGSKNKWYVYVKGKAIEHPVRMWKHIPHAPDFGPPTYEEVKEQVEEFKKLLS